jgi:hypothetical protein
MHALEFTPRSTHMHALGLSLVDPHPRSRFSDEAIFLSHAAGTIKGCEFVYLKHRERTRAIGSRNWLRGFLVRPGRDSLTQTMARCRNFYTLNCSYQHVCMMGRLANSPDVR